METPTIALGSRCRDVVSGWEGVATARYTYLNGCERYELSGLREGKPEGFVFDVQQIEVLADEPIELPESVTAVPAPAARASGDRSTSPAPR